MANTTWDTFYDHVLPEVPGVLQAFAAHQIKLAVIDFCNRSLCWVVDDGPTPLAAKVNVYDWSPPALAEVIKPMQVWVNKLPIDPKPPSDLSGFYGDFMQTEGAPRYYLAENPTQLIVVPKPISTSSLVQGITAKLAVKPTLAATGIDTLIFNQHYDAMAMGAKSRLMLMPKKPWSNAETGVYYRDKFDEAIPKARIAIRRGLSGAKLRARPAFF